MGLFFLVATAVFQTDLYPAVLTGDACKQKLGDFGRTMMRMEKKDSACYQPFFCSTNVLSLIQHLQESSTENIPANVLFIYPKSGKQNLYPQNSRNDDLEWRFHSVIAIDNEILDLDYGKKEPEFVAADVYFLKMFGSKNLDFNEIEIKTIPADSYLRFFKEYAWAYYVYHLSNEHDGFARESVSDYLLKTVPGFRRPFSLQPTTLDKRVEVVTGITELQDSNRKRFSDLDRNQKIIFKYVTMTVDKAMIETQISGRTLNIGKHSIQVETDGIVREIPYELIFTESILAVPSQALRER